MLDFTVLFVVLAVLYTIGLIFMSGVAMAINKIIRSRRRGTRLKIPADCPKTGRDFIVDFECPDGTVARIAIPVDPNNWEGRGSRSLGPDAPPVGLNLVCPGHYT